MQSSQMRKLVGVAFVGILIGFVSLSAEGQVVALADIINADGELIAVGFITEIGNRVDISIKASDLSPGLHGTHIHETGSCETPDFNSAGAHFGALGDLEDQNPYGAFAGDLPDMEVDDNGDATFQYAIELVSLSPGPFSLMDVDGSAIVIHQEPTDQSGAAGARIACGVIQLLGEQGEEEPQSETEVVHSSSGFSFGLLELVLGLIALIILVGIILRTM